MYVCVKVAVVADTLMIAVVVDYGQFGRGLHRKESVSIESECIYRNRNSLSGRGVKRESGSERHCQKNFEKGHVNSCLTCFLTAVSESVGVVFLDPC